jgi:cytidylate kinase
MKVFIGTLLCWLALAEWAAAGGRIIGHADGRELLEAHRKAFMEEALREKDGDGFVVVAIDGGAGSGKTSTARAVARARGFAFASTGEHYRVLACHLRELGIGADAPEAIGRALGKLYPTTIFTENRAHFTLDGRIPSDERLRRPEITAAVANYARVPALRAFLHNYQRELPAVARAAGFPGLVVEGRDMTTAVFPRATLRYFLRVAEGERVRRRKREKVYDNISARDGLDREHLTPAAGVAVIDGTGRTLEEVVAIIGGDLEALRGENPR